MNCNVKIAWDSEASMWIAISNDVPGLVLESNSYDALIGKVKVAIPELLELNNNASLKQISLSLKDLWKWHKILDKF